MDALLEEQLQPHPLPPVAFAAPQFQQAGGFPLPLGQQLLAAERGYGGMHGFPHPHPACQQLAELPGGGGVLPPAILQHQQAALAQQAPTQPDAQQQLLQQPVAVQQGGVGQATAAGAPLQQQGEEEQPRRRRGRKPKDASTLTEKQLRAREAQKRFRDKQRRAMTETESAMGATVAEMELLRWGLVGGAGWRVKACTWACLPAVLLNDWPCTPLPTPPPG